MQQSLAQEEDGAISQGTNIMQQNTRLIILTLEASPLALLALGNFPTFHACQIASCATS